MQNRYVGDIGDFVKYGLLRRLSAGMRLGVAWYLYPDEDHNGDGRHVTYLDEDERWRAYDPPLFDALKEVVRKGQRTVSAIETCGVLSGATFASQPLQCEATGRERASWRQRWFEDTARELADTDIVFADPDNGLCTSEKFRPALRKDGKRLPLAEVEKLAHGRCAVLYHHNSRRPGGHSEEIAHWLRLLPQPSVAVRARLASARTFFIVNPTPEVADRARQFAREWPGTEFIEQ